MKRFIIGISLALVVCMFGYADMHFPGQFPHPDSGVNSAVISCESELTVCEDADEQAGMAGDSCMVQIDYLGELVMQLNLDHNRDDFDAAFNAALDDHAEIIAGPVVYGISDVAAGDALTALGAFHASQPNTYAQAITRYGEAETKYGTAGAKFLIAKADFNALKAIVDAQITAAEQLLESLQE